jgi:CBS domain-containing protein
MKVQDAMVQDVQFCFPEDSLNRAAQLMWDHACGVVPVVDEARRAVGMLTDRDVCMAAYTQGKLLQDIRVSDVMRTQVRTCQPGESIARAERAMRDCGSRRVPVVDAEGTLVGILSLDDVARMAVAEQPSAGKAVDLVGVAETLAEVSKTWSMRNFRDAEGVGNESRSMHKQSSTGEPC